VPLETPINPSIANDKPMFNYQNDRNLYIY